MAAHETGDSAPTVRFLLSGTQECEAASKSLLIDTTGNIRISADDELREDETTQVRRCKLPEKHVA
jgi:hypothetical protein